MLSGSTRLHQSLDGKKRFLLTVLNGWFNDHALLSRPLEEKLQPIVTSGLPPSRKSQGKTKIFKLKEKSGNFVKDQGKS